MVLYKIIFAGINDIYRPLNNFERAITIFIAYCTMQCIHHRISKCFRTLLGINVTSEPLLLPLTGEEFKRKSTKTANNNNNNNISFLHQLFIFTTINICIYIINRNVDAWKNPNQSCRSVNGFALCVDIFINSQP